ncbi:MAG: thiolase family protein [Sulfitobacter sp.]
MSISNVIISGAAVTPFNRRKDGTGFRDWASDAFGMAIKRAELDRTEIGALFVASESDFFSLQLNPASILATELGVVGVAAQRIEGGGASGQLAVHAAVKAVASGVVRHAAVVGVDPSASSLSGDAIRALYGFSFDAWTDGLSGVTSTALYALSYQAFAAEHDVTDDDLAAVTIQNRKNAQANPGAHLPRAHTIDEIADSPFIASPYRRLHCSPLSDGSAVLIVSHKDNVPQTRSGAPRIAGIGAATDHMHLGARATPGVFTAKSKAMQKACTMAQVTPKDIGFAEIYDAYAGAQLQAISALGLSDAPGPMQRAGVFGPEGSCPINLSGGLMGQGAPVGATGVAQTATCALQLEGCYHTENQLTSPPQYALADTHGGVCTSSAVTILKQGAHS